MAKKIALFITAIILTISTVSASSDTVFFSIDKAASFKDGRVIRVILPNIPSAYLSGQVEVDLIPKDPSLNDSVTLKDTTFTISWLSGTTYTSELQIDLVNLMGRFLERLQGEMVEVTPEHLKAIKDQGFRWRIVLNRDRTI